LRSCKLICETMKNDFETSLRRSIDVDMIDTCLSLSQCLDRSLMYYDLFYSSSKMRLFLKEDWIFRETVIDVEEWRHWHVQRFSISFSQRFYIRESFFRNERFFQSFFSA
jgi:hypothetical protein